MEKIVSHSEQISKNNSIELKLEKNMVHDKNEMTTLKRKSVAIKKDQEMLPPLKNTTELASETVKGDNIIKVLVDLLEPVKSECNTGVLTKKESTGILLKSVNKFTQTEWCDVLVSTSSFYSYVF